jgi:hypothetical protein
MHNTTYVTDTQVIFQLQPPENRLVLKKGVNLISSIQMQIFVFVFLDSSMKHYTKQLRK